MKYHLPILAASLAVAGKVALAERNVLLIIADDMGLDASRCYDIGNQQAPMPNPDALCASGLVFDNAYAQPTRSPTEPSDLDACRGHVAEGIGYHYNANKTSQNAIMTCHTAQVGCSNAGTDTSCDATLSLRRHRSAAGPGRDEERDDRRNNHT